MDGQVPTTSTEAPIRTSTIRVPTDKWKVISKMLIDRGGMSLNKWVNQKVDEEIAKVQNPTS